MAFSFKNVSKGQIDAAGEVLHKGVGDLEAARDLARLWRTSHFFTTQNSFARCQKIAHSLQADAIVTSRHKRMESIEGKLRRSTVRLSKMQDIAGCRMIFKNIAQVREAEEKMASVFGQHSRKNDYIQSPKPDGYRGVHCIYPFDNKYVQTGGTSVEIQIRTELQHAWATALETVDAFTGQGLKSGFGKSEWARFFTLAGSALALREGCPVVPGSPQTKHLLSDELKRAEESIQLFSTYAGVQSWFSKGSMPATPYFIIHSDMDNNSADVTPVESSGLEIADAKVSEIERRIAKTGARENVVLVSVDAMSSVRDAYPNYFADMTRFLEEIGKIIT